MITYERLREVLEYDSETGIFRWKERLSIRINVGDIAGTYDAYGYKNICIDGIKYKAHRLAWLYINGKMPTKDLDHINRIKDDNRICNLREVTPKQNMVNKSLHSVNTSKICGVYWAKHRSKWTVQISINGKKTYIGRYATKLEAAKVRRKAELKYGYAEFLTDSSALTYILKHEPNYEDTL